MVPGNDPGRIFGSRIKSLAPESGLSYLDGKLCTGTWGANWILWIFGIWTSGEKQNITPSGSSLVWGRAWMACIVFEVDSSSRKKID